ncbi:MAG: GHKL domain-containing protein [Spirochaetales bacterium]|nr:MAG: GHKL domain-containing protein [Spirochaetales bacterium]
MSIYYLMTSAAVLLILGIFIIHSLHKSPKRPLHILLSWSGSAYFVAELCMIIGQLVMANYQMSFFLTVVFSFFTVLFNYFYLFPDAPNLDRAFCFFFVLNITTLLEMATNVTANVLAKQHDGNVGLIFVSLFVFLSVLYCVFFKYYFKTIFRNGLKVLNSDPFGPVAFIISCYLITLILVLGWVEEFAYSMWDAIPYFLLIVLTHLSVTAFSTIRRNVMAEAEADYARKILAMSQRYFSEQLSNYEHVCKLDHDMRNHQVVLQGLCCQQDWRSVQVYIEEMGQQLPASQLVSLCELQELNILLNHYRQQFERARIRFECSARLPKDIVDESIQLCIIFGNALGNALEACDKMEESEERFTELIARVKDGRLIICCRNSFSGILHRDQEGRLATGKQEPGHGLGLGNIAEVVRRFNGWMSTASENNVFTLSAVLHLSEGAVWCKARDPQSFERESADGLKLCTEKSIPAG